MRKCCIAFEIKRFHISLMDKIQLQLLNKSNFQPFSSLFEMNGKALYIYFFIFSRIFPEDKTEVFLLMRSKFHYLMISPRDRGGIVNESSFEFQA